MKKEKEVLGIKDDEEMFAMFALFDKIKEHPEDLTSSEKVRLRELGIEV